MWCLCVGYFHFFKLQFVYDAVSFFYLAVTWEYLDTKTVRIYGDTTPSATWNSLAWVIATTATTADMTPEWHRDTITWTGSVSTNWNEASNWQTEGSTSVFAPDAGAYILLTSQGQARQYSNRLKQSFFQKKVIPVFCFRIRQWGQRLLFYPFAKRNLQ